MKAVIEVVVGFIIGGFIGYLLYQAAKYDKKKAKQDREAKDEIIRKAGK